MDFLNGFSRGMTGLVAGLTAVFLAGCGNPTIFPVHGQILDANRKPVTELEGGTVEFESTDGKTSANGPIDAEGRFRLTTERPGDGARVGPNRVAITRPYRGPDTPAPRVIDAKYDSPATSGLEVDVKPTRNEIELVVERVAPRSPSR